MRFFISSPPVYAIEIFGTSTAPLFELSILQTANRSIGLKDQQSFQDWESLIAALPKNAHVIWVINDEGVLTKVNEINREQPFESAFPQIDKQSFYWKASAQLWCLIRKEHWNYWVERIQTVECLTIDIQLGSCALSSLEQHWDQSIRTNRHLFTYKDGILTAQSSLKGQSDTSVPLAGDLLPSKSLLGFAAAVAYRQVYPYTNGEIFRFLIPQVFRTLPSFDNLFEAQQAQLVINVLNLRFRTLLLQWSGIVIALLLLISIGLQFWKTNAQEQFRSQEKELKILQKESLQLDSLWTETQTQWERIQTKSTIQVVPQLDRILKEMPSGIILHQLRWEKSKSISSRQVAISIKGTLLNKADLNLWSERLTLLPTLAQFRIAQLVATPQSAKFNFELQIHLYASSL